MALLPVGASAPDFSLPDQSGHQLRLTELLSDGPVVMFFYPKDETTICTKEACGFRDAHDDFRASGARVLGISGDSVASHSAFAEHHKLPFSLLADEQGAVARLYGVKKTLGLIPGRATFVIGQDRVVRVSFSSALEAHAHIDQALRAIRELA